MKIFLVSFALLSLSLVRSQELSCKVTVDARQINQTNKQVFINLEKKLQEFINTTAWTNTKVQSQEKIECNLTFVLNQYDDDNFIANLQIQASRPVYGSNYQSTIFNHRENISFTFLEHTPLVFNPEEFTSNLLSIVAYYAYLIIGIDADTFALGQGKPHFEKAFQIALLAQNAPDNAWKDNGENNRWMLLKNLLSPEYELWHKALYSYHRQGLDLMHNNPHQGKKGINQAINFLSDIQQNRLSSFPIQIFFDAKSSEISEVFSTGNTPYINTLKEQLLRIAPREASLWQKLK